ncbi:phosphoribosylformylglycinamidine synthase [Mucilaginibacter hurinus]|uniref:Phosphoribosylformylglycinamidine synthase n=1 Tax=Mucilaginibacter hurinus TaxID=2201324 RepID=A0A367GMM3_9SPHI|nr:HAEPLYID family protein [Mucilaginibacter hurinus]RCH54278.1 phosphoribosylformylglycinamidine synthase [Mucilaginibacter hurinus]
MIDNKIYPLLLLILPLFYCADAVAQTGYDANETLDSIYINEVEDKQEPDKVLHAEPLYIDLIRDLGARKGEREWNVGLGLKDNNTYDEYTALVEYEFAPINRLGFEVELPFSFYYPTANGIAAPGSKLNSLKLATQYSFFVSDKIKTSMALGYIQEFELSDFRNYGKEKLFTGKVYNPFFVAAKRLGQNFHTLLYTGPQFIHHNNHAVTTNWQINSSFHYMITGTRNFIGIEFNKEVRKSDFDMTIRPQMRVSVADNLLIGIVTGIPIKRESERFSTFLRLIYEPAHKH